MVEIAQDEVVGSTQVDQAQLMKKILELSSKIEALSKVKAPSSAGAKLNTSKVFTCTGEMEQRGSVPQQQKDIASILMTCMLPDEKYSEADMVGYLEECKDQFPSLANSRQPMVRLLRYYATTPINSPSRPNHWNFLDRGFLVKS